MRTVDMSLPMRERGLKLYSIIIFNFLLVSLPMRERGLKLYLTNKFVIGKDVAPHAGAWIETLSHPH